MKNMQTKSSIYTGKRYRTDTHLKNVQIGSEKDKMLTIGRELIQELNVMEGTAEWNDLMNGNIWEYYYRNSTGGVGIRKSQTEH